MAAATRQALQRMGMSNRAASYATSDDGLGLTSLERFRDLHTDPELSSFVKNLKSPGGTIQQGGQQVRHPGFQISMVAISNLKVLRLALKYYQHVQRNVTPAMVTLNWLADWEFLVGYHEMVAKTTIVEADLPKIMMTDWARTKEKIEDHFSGLFGEEGIPLAYILRDEGPVPAEADDPRENYEGDHIKEMVARAPHQGRVFDADNRKMCGLIKKICASTPAYEYVGKYTANGRRAWLDLMQVYLGPQHTQNQASIYEAKIMNARFDGETSRFTYDQYVNIQRSAHTRLQALIKHGYVGMDQGTLIRHHLNGAKWEKLKAVIELLRGNPEYDTFDKVTRRIKDTIVTLQPMKAAPSRTVSAVVTNRRGDEMFPGVEPDTSMQDAYYPPEQWAKLSKAKKKGVMLARQKRGGAPGKAKAPDADEKKKLKKENKRLRKTVASLTKKVSGVSIDDDADGSSDDEPAKKKKNSTTNRNHPATNRD